MDPFLPPGLMQVEDEAPEIVIETGTKHPVVPADLSSMIDAPKAEPIHIPDHIMDAGSPASLAAQELTIPQRGEKLIFDCPEPIELGGGTTIPSGTRLHLGIAELKRAVWHSEHQWIFLVQTSLAPQSLLWVSPSFDSPVPWINLSNVSVPPK